MAFLVRNTFLLGLISFTFFMISILIIFRIYSKDLKQSLPEIHFQDDVYPYCESFSSISVPLQWINAWSCMIYCLFGIMALFESPLLWLAWFNRDHDDTAKNDVPSVRLVFALVMIFLGFGSFAFHAFFLDATAILDFCGMIGMTLFVLSFTILRLCHANSPKPFLILFGVLSAMALILRLVLFYTIDYDVTVPLFSLLLVHLILELYMNIRNTLFINEWEKWIQVGRCKSSQTKDIFAEMRGLGHADYEKKYVYAPRSWKWFFAIISFSLLGGILWILDERFLCQSNSWFQVHALWHVLTAFAGLFSYYYVSHIVITKEPPSIINPYRFTLLIIEN